MRGMRAVGILASAVAVLMLPGCSHSSPGVDASGEARLVSLAISPARHAIAPGTRARLALVARYSDGTVRNWTRRAVWSSSAPGVARVVSPGVVVGRAEGSATVRATVGRRTGTGLLEVGPSGASLLRTGGSNPAYFSDGSGRPVYLAGAHTWSDLLDSGSSDPPPRFDDKRFLEMLQIHGLNLTRLWAWEQARWTTETGGDYRFSPLVFKRPGPGRALDGGPRFDLGRLNPAYFARVRARVITARERGIYVVVMLFNGWSVEEKGPRLNNPWDGHPFNARNNVNGIDGDANGDGSGREIHTLSDTTVTRLQDAYVRRVVDAVGDQPNVLFEISNESSAGSIEWQNHMVRIIRDRERDRPLKHPIGMTAEWPGGDNADLRASAADWISPNGSIDDPETAGDGKVVLHDTDHLCGVCGDPGWPWRSATRGLNPLFMDVYDGAATGLGARGLDPHDPTWERIRRALGTTRAVLSRLDLSRMLPRGDLSSTGFCLADASRGGTYLVFIPGGGRLTVDLSGTPGELRPTWVHPETGVTRPGRPVRGGARRELTPPFSGDGVLVLRALGIRGGG